MNSKMNYDYFDMVIVLLKCTDNLLGEIFWMAPNSCSCRALIAIIWL